jgi:CBS domain-containing protein
LRVVVGSGRGTRPKRSEINAGSEVAEDSKQEATMQPVQTSVSALMSRPVLTIGPDARAGEVLALAGSAGVHHFPIVEQGKLVGIVCTCDLQELSSEAKVLQVAWQHVITLRPEASLSDAARLMALQGVGSIVVSDAEGVHGIVTRADLLRADPELDRLLLDARCAACGARSHLRPGPAGQCLCQSCQARAKDGVGLDLGDGD